MGKLEKLEKWIRKVKLDITTTAEPPFKRRSQPSVGKGAPLKKPYSRPAYGDAVPNNTIICTSSSKCLVRYILPLHHFTKRDLSEFGKEKHFLRPSFGYVIAT